MASLLDPFTLLQLIKPWKSYSDYIEVLMRLLSSQFESLQKLLDVTSFEDA